MKITGNMIALLYILFLITLTVCEDVTISMPGVTTSHKDQYLCTAIKLNNASKYIRKFTVNADASKAHHMILFGCDIVSDDKVYPKFWDCGSARICNGHMSIKYAWAKNAPPTNLPKDVGFEIGSQRSKVQYLILQVHYAILMKPGEHDHSSIVLNVSPKMPTYLAGIHLLLASDGVIPAHSPVTHIDANCQYRDRNPMYIFAYRTHAHKLGRVITGYRYRQRSRDKWSLIAKGNPQWPQSFYPTDKIYEIRNFDYLISRCTYNASKMSYAVRMGSTEADEMCNLYLMFYTNATNRFPYGECIGVENPKLALNLPLGNDVPLPPNSLLERIASEGGHKEKNKEDLSKSSHKEKYSYKGMELSVNYSKIGQISAVTLDSDGNIFLFHRGSKVWNGLTFDANNRYRWASKGPIEQHTILHINSMSGKIIDQFGENVFYMPHGLTIDGDYIWVTDVALHQVKKFSWQNGKLIEKMSLGQKFKPGSDSNHFCKPTSVAIDSDGSFFISDGYCNSRIMKFSAKGQLITQWGYPTPAGNIGPDAPTSSFYIPHKILIIQDKNLVCVADRENGRVQCFDKDSHKIQNIITDEKFGSRLFSISYTPIDGGLIFGVNGPNDQYPTKGFIMDVSTKKIINTFSPSASKKLSNPHDISISHDGNVFYIVEIGPNRVWKFNRDYHNSTVSSPNTETSHVDHKVVQPASSSVSLFDDSSKNEIVNKTITSAPSHVRLNTTLTILALLAIPILLIVMISIFFQMRKRGVCISKSKQDKFNVGNFLNRHKGFDRVSTQEDDLDAIESSDSDIEEFNLKRTKA